MADEIEPIDIRRTETATIAFRTRRGLEKTDVFVIADGRDLGSRGTRKCSDRQIVHDGFFRLIL